MSPAVSILLPVYNGASFLEAAIDSVLNQSFRDFELIIFDDCSLDDSVEIIERKCAGDGRIKFFRNERNQGLFANYNRCLSSARGRLIKPAAQDDIIYPHCLERMVGVLENDPELSLVSCARNITDAKGEIVESKLLFPEDRKIAGKDVILYNLLALSNWIGEPSAVMFRADSVSTGFDTNLYHYGDADMWFSVLKNGHYYFVAESLAEFRRHGDSASSSNLCGLLFALDLVYLGKKYRCDLEEFGESQEHFLLRVAEYAAMELDHLIGSEGLTVHKCVEAAIKGTRLAKLGPDDERRLFSAFVELNYVMMRSLTHTIKNLSDVQHRTSAEKTHLLRTIENMKNSTSWKLTEPLRVVVERVKEARTR